ncbi:MAG: hypothetical protein MI810_04440, partial [Flavobacteriales bacterium]|nr:hypothetical protein [Flavobacteriales bacterium]
YNHYSPSAGVLKFTMPWVKFANDSHDELYKLCGERRPDGIWELGVKNQKTYQRGPKEYGEIQTFNSYLFLDEDEMEELNYQVVAWNHNGNPFERDELLFEEDASLAVQKDVPTKVPFYHHLLADTVALDFLVSDLIPTETKTEYTHPKVQEFKLQNYKDTIWNGMFVRMFTLNVKHDLPYGAVSIRRYPFRSNTRLIYKDSLSGKPNLALDSGETTCQFIELIPRDFESEAYFKLIQKNYDCANPIKANFPSIDSSALYNLKVIGSKKYKNDSYVLLGDHLNPSMSQTERKKLPQHKIEKTSPYSYLRAGWEGKLYEKESITLYINSSKGDVRWSGVPSFNKKGKCTLKLMSEEGKKVKIKMIVLEDLE